MTWRYRANMNERRGWSHASCVTIRLEDDFGLDKDHWEPLKENNDSPLWEERDAVGSGAYEQQE